LKQRQGNADQMTVYKPGPLQKVRDTEVGQRVLIYDFVDISGAKIGDDTKISTFVEIQKEVTIGERCKICSHTLICQGVTIEDEVFIGHGVVFVPQQLPYAGEVAAEKNSDGDGQTCSAQVGKGASVGSGAAIIGKVTIGKRAIVGAGAVVLEDVPDGMVVVGNPARVIGQAPSQSFAAANRICS